MSQYKKTREYNEMKPTKTIDQKPTLSELVSQTLIAEKIKARQSARYGIYVEFIRFIEKRISERDQNKDTEEILTHLNTARHLMTRLLHVSNQAGSVAAGDSAEGAETTTRTT